MAIHRLDDIGGQRFVNKVTAKGMYPDGKGLYLQVGEGGGSKSFLFRYALGGRERQKGLGSAFTVTLNEARDRARECRLLLDRGIDPLEQDRVDELNRQLAKAKEVTFRQCGEEWFANNEADWEPATVTGHRNRLEKHIYPKLAHLPIQKFDMRLPDSSATQIVEELLRPLWRKQTNTALKMQQHIEGILNTAIAKRYIAGDNAASIRKDSPLRILLKHPKDFHRAKTLPHLPFEELPDFMAKLRGRIESAGLLRAGSQDPRCQVCASPHVAEIHAAREAGASIDQLGGRFGIHRATIYRHLTKHFGAANVDAIRAPVGALAMEFIILVPARKMQVAAAEWKDIQEIEGVPCLVSPAQRANGQQGHKTGRKTGKDYAIPLSKQAVALLDRMKQYQDASGIKSDFVFPGGQGGKASNHLSRTTVNKFLNVSLGRPDVTVHGFRHTFGNWAHRNGHPETDSEIALGHVIGDRSRNSYKDDIKRLRNIRDMLQAYANYCDQGPLPSQNVASLLKHKAAGRAAR
jgi:integrase